MTRTARAAVLAAGAGVLAVRRGLWRRAEWRSAQEWRGLRHAHAATCGARGSRRSAARRVVECAPARGGFRDTVLVPAATSGAMLRALFCAMMCVAWGCEGSHRAQEQATQKQSGTKTSAAVTADSRGPGQDYAVPADSLPPSAAGVAEPSHAPTTPVRSRLVSPPSAADPVRVVRSTGEHSVEAVAGIGERLRTGANGELVVDLANGARARIGADAEVWSLAFAPATLVVLSGGVFVQLLPEGNREGRSALTLDTADAAIRVPGNAELWVEQRVECVKSQLRAAVNPLGRVPPVRSYVALIRGQGELLRLGKDNAITSIALDAAAARARASEQPKVMLASTLAEAQTGATAYFRKRGAPSASERGDAVLVRALEALAAEREQGATLLSQISPAAAQRARARGVSVDAGESARAQRDEAMEASARGAAVGEPRRGQSSTAAELGTAGVKPGAASPEAHPSAAIVRPGSAADVRTYQRALTAHAQRQHDLERAVSLAAVQSLSSTLLGCAPVCAPAAVKCDPLERWRTRFGAALAHDGAQALAPAR